MTADRLPATDDRPHAVVARDATDALAGRADPHRALHRPHRPRVTVAVLAGLAAVLAVLGMLGWILDVEGLRALVPDGPAVKFNTALAVLVLAVALVVPRWAAAALGGLVLVFCLVVLVEFVADTSFLDEAFVDDAARTEPGRSSVLTTLCLAALGVAVLLRALGRGRRSEWPAAAVVVVAGAVVVAYWYGARDLLSDQRWATIALPTALALLLLGVATLASVERGGFTWATRAQDAGAVLLRRLLPLIVVGLPVIGWLCVSAYRHGWVQDTDATLALAILLCVLLTGSLTWFVARRVARIDRRRRRTVDELDTLRVALTRLADERGDQLQQRGGEISVLEDRQRIAADLHDIVIQRLFAAGMYLQGANRPGTLPEVRERINTAIEAMDVAIKDLRHSIFELSSRAGMPVDLTTAVDEICREATRVLGFRPDAMVDDPELEAETVREDLLAVLREALSNVARHAHASSVEVRVRAADGQVHLLVADDGRGMGEVTHNSGTRNIAERARHRGGDCEWTSNEPSGTRLHWHVPVRRRPAAV